MRLVDRLTVLLLAALFGFAGVDKLFHYGEFTNALASYRVVPLMLAASLAPLVIGLELAIATGLLFCRWRMPAALSAAVLTAAFTVVLWIENRLGAKDACGCWFSVDLVPDRFHVLLNVVLVGLALSVWWAERVSNRPPETLPTTA